jgi:type I restriction enzyme S subunit
MDVLCIRGTDFDMTKLRVDEARLPVRSITSADWKARRLRPGDIVVEKSGGGEQQPVGRAVLFDFDRAAVPTNFAARLRPEGGHDSRFLTYLLSSCYATGTTRSAIKQTTGIQNLDLDAFLSERVLVPDEYTQRALADFLDDATARIDALIEEKRRMIDVLEERRVAMTAAAVMDRSWPRVKLTLLARLGSGHTPSRDRPDWWASATIPWITTRDVAQLRGDRIEFIENTKLSISELGLANSAAELHPTETVVLSRTASVGFSAIMARPMATSQDFATWTCGPRLRSRFLLLCLRAMRSELLGRLAMGSTHKTIYMPDIEGIRVPLPPVEEQDRIVNDIWARLRPIDAAVAAIERQISLLREHRQALVTAAVTGELDVVKAAA